MPAHEPWKLNTLPATIEDDDVLAYLLTDNSGRYFGAIGLCDCHDHPYLGDSVAVISYLSGAAQVGDHPKAARGPCLLMLPRCPDALQFRLLFGVFIQDVPYHPGDSDMCGVTAAQCSAISANYPRTLD